MNALAMPAPTLELNDLTLDLPSQGKSAALGTDPRFLTSARGHVTFRALEKVSLTAKPGDRIALIGRNGAGKTTLLRTICGIYHATDGTLRCNGRMRVLLNPGMGVEPEMSGMGNIRILGLLNGLTDREIDDARPRILEFAELDEFIDMPVKNYSAGMRMRLIYAIVTSGTPDILLLDEVIGVGDKAFVHKANERRRKFMSEAEILILASHAEGIIKQFCNRVIWLDAGRIIADSTNVGETLQAYNNAVVADAT